MAEELRTEKEVSPLAEQIIGALIRTFQPETVLLLSPAPLAMGQIAMTAAPKAALRVIGKGADGDELVRLGNGRVTLEPEDDRPTPSRQADFLLLDGRSVRTELLSPLIEALSEGGFLAVYDLPADDSVTGRLSANPGLICEVLDAGVILCMKKRAAPAQISTQ